MTPSPASALAHLTHNRWCVPVLAAVSRAGGCKFVTLSRQLGASPASVRRALTRLAELELVIPNPGYGHPMRPEYILGPLGERTGALSSELVLWAERDGFAAEVFKKWQLPLVVALGTRSRFSELRGELAGASPRALALALKSQASLGLVRRDIESGYPPVPVYTPTALAREGQGPAGLLGALLLARSAA